MVEGADYRPKGLWLLQVDLANHTSWAKGAQSIPSIVEARLALVNLLKTSLQALNFSIAFWAGDGGLFKADKSTVPANSIANAVDNVFDSFENWQQGFADRKELGFRVSVHADEVYVGPDSSLWFSLQLNLFLKYERSLSEVGSAIITNEVYKHLSVPEQKRWIDHGTVHMGSGDSESWRRYYDAKRPPRPTKQPFGRWLANWPGALPGLRAAKLKNLYGACGEAGLLIPALSEDGFIGNIVMENVDQGVAWAPGLEPIAAPRQDDFVKLALVAITKSNTDTHGVYLDWIPCNYRHALEVQTSLELDETIWARHATNATKTELTKGEFIPRILCGHIVVLLESGANRWIIASRRAKKEKQVDFYSGRWSISLEEQFRPLYNAKTREKKDVSLNACILRGVREELGEEAAIYNPRVSVHGFIVEALILNIAFLGLVVIQATPADVRNWAPPLDDGELDLVVALPVTSDLIDMLLNAGSAFPIDVIKDSEILKGNHPSGEEELWHPTSAMRLALAKWYVENPK